MAISVNLDLAKSCSLAGGAVAALYVLGLILLGQRFASGPIALANAVFIMCYTAGLGVGPVLVGATMDAAGSPRVSSIMLAALYLLFFVVRRVLEGDMMEMERPRRSCCRPGPMARAA